LSQVTKGIQAVEHLKVVLEKAQASFPNIRRQALIYLPESGDAWRLGYGRVTSTPTHGAPLTLSYPRVIYEEQHLSIEEAVRWFTGLATRKEWKVEGNPLEITGDVHFTHTYETQKAYIPFSPCHYVRSSVPAHHGGGWHYDALLAPGQPVYPNINALLQDKFGVRDLNGQAGTFELFLPVHAARISNVRAKGRKLTVTVVGASPEDELLIRAWALHGARHMSEEAPLSQGSVALRFPAPPQHSAVYIVDKSGTLIDAKLSEDEDHARSAGHAPSKRELQRLIADGESTMLEFKNYRDKNIRISLAREVDVKEVATHLAAFANTEGGTLLIGVDDDGSIAGVDDPRGIKGKITDAAHDVCDPRLTPDLFTVRIGQATVVGAYVEKGRTLHHAGNMPYVRRNATTRKATAGEATAIANQAGVPGRRGGYGIPGLLNT
jgi:hypothetical protein